MILGRYIRIETGNKASVDLSVVRNHDFKIGDKGKVEYWYVGESSPLTIYVKPMHIKNSTEYILCC